MTVALLLTLAKADDIPAGGPLTLIFPLILLFVIVGLWALAFRRFRGEE